MNEWFRSWHGAPTDPKWRTIAKRAKVASSLVVAVAWALMDRASQNMNRGSIDGLDAETLADFLDCEVADIERVIVAMREKCVLTDNAFSAWEKRQPKREREDAGSTDRVRAFRERQREAAKVDGVSESRNDCNTQGVFETPWNAMERHETPRLEERREEKKEAATQLSRAGELSEPKSQDPPPNRFDEVARLCADALGRDAPADMVIGPIMVLVDRGLPISEVLTILRSEAHRPRRKPIRTWGMWAQIVAEKLDDVPKLAAKIEDPDDPSVKIYPDVVWKQSSIIEELEKWKKNKYKWHQHIGPPPNDPGCRIPEHILERCGLSVQKSKEAAA